MTTTPSASAADPAAGAAVKAADRAHVFHSWSAQGLIDPLAVAGRRGLVLLGLRRQPLPRLLLPAGQHQHRPPAPQGRRRDPGAGGEAVHHRARVRRRRTLRGRPAGRRAHPRRPRQDLLHQRRCGGGRERGPDGPAAHRPPQGAVSAYRSYHGATSTAINLTGDPRRWPSDTASAGVVHFWGPFLYRSHFHAETEAAGVRARPRAPGADHRLRGPADRSPRSSWRPSPGTAGDPGAAGRLPRRGPRDLRPLRHRLHPRRGHGGLRPHRRAGSPPTTSASPPTC